MMADIKAEPAPTNLTSRKPRVLVVSALLHPRHGGPPAVVASHLHALRDRAEVTVFGLHDGDDVSEILSRFPDARLFPTTWPRRWFRGAGLRRALYDAAAEADLLHAHMLWDHTVWAAWKAAQATHKPLVITPHGSLAQAWRLRGPHKRLYSSLILRPMLADPRVTLHVLNEAEAEACRRAGFAGRMVIVPNGVDREALLAGASDLEARWPALAGRYVLLYMGRLWHEKGLDVLLDAWSAMARSDWTLVLAGPDYRDYRGRLEQKIETLGLGDRVLLTGPVDGTAKASLLAGAEGFVLPSFGEGIPMSLIEAAAAGLPTVFTDACNLPALATAGGGREVPAHDADALRRALADLVAMPPAARERMGAAGRELATREFGLAQVGDGLMRLYDEALSHA